MDSLTAAIVVVSSPATPNNFHRSFTMAEGDEGERGLFTLLGPTRVVDILEFGVDGKLRRPCPPIRNDLPAQERAELWTVALSIRCLG
jgi:hypothetical protein